MNILTEGLIEANPLLSGLALLLLIAGIAITFVRRGR